MASFSSSQANATSNPVNRELNLIASSFVKQYYTLLNKAPCYIHNFYSHDSTFIHGTIEMANEHYTAPVVGREKIRNKMEELKLSDCRAKIKQIDCLETLARGLVIQVIGELSNNGRPMRRFLQTFVLAPSPDDKRFEGDSQNQQQSRGNSINNNNNDARRPVHQSENNTGQKFFVLNSIFRYQDDGPDSEFEEDSASIHANTSTENAAVDNEPINEQNNTKINPTQVPLAPVAAPRHLQQQREQQQQQQQQQQPQQPSAAVAAEPRRVEIAANAKVIPNGTGVTEKKSETSEKSVETSKLVHEQPAQNVTSTTSNVSPQSVSIAPDSVGGIQATATPTQTATRPPPSNEPRTWANMVRNASNAPPPASLPANAPKVSTEHNQNPSQTPSAHSHQHPQPPLQAQPQQQQQQSQQQQHPQQQQQQQPPQQQQQATQSQQQQPLLQQQQPQTDQQNMQSNNRRRHMIRKASNKPAGRPMKNRPRPAPTGKPLP